jgi:type VI secretion system protein ImpF
MPGLSQKDRLLPSLLDRLRGREEERALYSEHRLRESVKRDLAWLFNTTNFETVQDLSAHPEVARSVLNFGLPSLAGQPLSSLSLADVEAALRRAILDFEPRLMRSTVKIRIERDTQQMNHNALSFTISADLWAQPLPLHILLRTNLDLESGHVEVLDASGASDEA